MSIFSDALRETVASGSITTQNLVPAGAATAGSSVELIVSTRDTVSVQVTGTYTGALSIQATIDGVTWVTLTGGSVLVRDTGVYSATIPSAGVGIWTVGVGSYRSIRVSALAAVTGTAVISMAGVDGNSHVAVDNALPAGSATIGSVGINGSGTTSIAKLEDVAGASGDMGALILAQRAPATAVALTSAAGDYGTVQIDAEGKTVSMPLADPIQHWQSAVVTLTTTGSTSLKAAAAAGIRNYVTGVVLANTSATGTRVDILDNATVMASYWLPATSTIIHEMRLPKKGTAATAVNVQLGTAVTDVRVSASGFLGI